MGFDLCGVGIEFQAQRADETRCQRGPVEVGIGDHVGVVIADRAVDLAEHGDRFELR